MEEQQRTRKAATMSFTPLLIAAVLMLVICPAAPAVETVTLAPRQFSPASPAAPFQKFFVDMRRLTASTTPVWQSVESDLSAWGPALIFPLLEGGVSRETVLGLAAPLQETAPAPVLLFRTIGLYAVKSRLPFADTPTVMRAINRNLGLIERATRDLEAFTSGPELKEWGSVGAGAWLAYLELLYRDYGDLGDPGATSWNANGLRTIDELLVRGRLAGNSGFRRDPREEQLGLWPTALMIHALVKAYENEEAVRYESAAIAAAAAVESLRAEDGSYFSTPASTRTDVRANIYLASALLLLSKDTGEVSYRERATGILRWLTEGAGAAAVSGDASLGAHVAYLVLLLDSLATQPYENVLGRRPMRLSTELEAPSGQAVDTMAARLRPAGFRYREMFDAILHTLVQRVPRAAGDFAYDYGDAPGYAASVLFKAGDTILAPDIVSREERLVASPRPRHFDEIAFGTRALLAALDHPDLVDPPSAMTALRRYLLLSGTLAFADRYYLDWLDWFTNGGGYDYGPTVLGAQIASTHLEFARRFPDQTVGWRLHPLDMGRALIDGANTVAWDAERHVYRARPASEAIWLLPNAMIILDLLRLERLTGEAAYRARAAEVAGGLDAVWDDTRKAYFASSEQMGDNAYESLSTNSYAALAMLRLFEATHEPSYQARASAVFEFIRRDLYRDGIVYHHLYQGRRASGDIWCVGCNWRILAALMELAHVNAPE